MDPFKLLGVAPTSVKTTRDLEPLRQRTKRKFKELMARNPPARFDAKKLLEAFEMVKKKIKRPEGMDKILGRSRKEREMDKHFNHQTKEIKKEKKRHVKSRAERLHGGQVRLFHEKTDRIKKYVPPKKKLRTTAEQTDIIQALQRIVGILPSPQKFPKALELLGKWVREYMNVDNKDYVLDAMQSILRSGHHVEFDECRLGIISLFEYVIGYNKAWFDETQDRRMLKKFWQLAAVLHNECFTDDQFKMNSVIVKMREYLQLLETPPPPEEEPDLIIGPSLPGVKSAGPAAAKVCKEDSKEEVDDLPVAGPALGPGMMKGPPEEPKVKREEQPAQKKEEPDSDNEDHFDEEVAAFPGEEAFFPGEGPASSPSPSPVPARRDKNEKKERGSGVVKVEDGAEEIISSGSDAGGNSEDDDGSDEDCVVEEVEQEEEETEFLFPAPSASDSFTSMQHHYLMCIGALMKQRKHAWARQRIEVLIQDIFYVREKCFLPDQLSRIEEWQAEIKTKQKGRDVGKANITDQTAKATYVDARAEKLDFSSSADAWGAKQLHVSQGFVNG